MNRFENRLRPLPWLAASTLLAALAGMTTPGVAQSVTLLSTSPSNGATNTPTSTNGSNNVVTGTAVSATFSTAMNPATLDSPLPGSLLTFTLRDSNGNTIEGTKHGGDFQAYGFGSENE